MQHLAVFLTMALAAMVASTRGLPTPGIDQEGNTTSPASAETYDEFTSLPNREPEVRNLQNYIEEDGLFPVDMMREALVRTRRLVPVKRGVPVERGVPMVVPVPGRTNLTGGQVDNGRPQATYVMSDFISNECSKGFIKLDGKCRKISYVSRRTQTRLKPKRVAPMSARVKRAEGLENVPATSTTPDVCAAGFKRQEDGSCRGIANISEQQQMPEPVPGSSLSPTLLCSEGFKLQNGSCRRIANISRRDQNPKPKRVVVPVDAPMSARLKRAGGGFRATSITPNGCSAGFKKQNGTCRKVVSGRVQRPKPRG